MIDSLGTYTGTLVDNLPEGYGTKIYKTGHSITGNWVKGRPEGKFNFTYQNISESVTFKNGLISRIHTKSLTVSLYFPYKFESTSQGFKETVNNSESSWYSVITTPNQIYSEKVVNRRLKNVIEQKLKSNVYKSETLLGIPHGYGVFEFRLGVYIGFLKFGLPDGKGYFLNDQISHKGNFINFRIDGYGVEYMYQRQVKYKGHFKSGLKQGLFHVIFEDFRLEVNYSNNKLVNPVKYYRKNCFIFECNASKLTLLPEHEYMDHLTNSKNVDMIYLFTKFSLLILCQSSKLDLKKNFQDIVTNTSSKKKSNILPDIESWLDYEMQESFKKQNLGKEKQVRSSSPKKLSKIIYQKDEFFVGELTNGIRSGLGVYVKDSETFFKGYWKNNRPNGLGIIWTNQLKIKGLWNEGKLHKIYTIISNE